MSVVYKLDDAWQNTKWIMIDSKIHWVLMPVVFAITAVGVFKETSGYTMKRLKPGESFTCACCGEETTRDELGHIHKEKNKDD